MDYTSIKVGQLPTDAIANTNLIPHEVGGLLKKATIADLAAFIGSSSAVGFRAVSVPNGGTLPTTTQQEFILVGPGTYNNVGGGSPITVTEELNALVSNGTFWFIGVEIPIDPVAAGTASWGGIGGTLSNQTDLQTALNAKEPSILSGTTAQYWRGDKSWQTLDKTAVGLENVDNTSDANKPVSTATQTALNAKANDNAVVKLTGNQSITGIKTFTTVSGNALTINNPTGDWGQVINNTSTGQGLQINNSSTGVGLVFLSSGTSTGNIITHQGIDGLLKFRLNSTGDVTANSFIKSGGTAAQILAADGSVITAGTNITISGGVISASGGGSTGSLEFNATDLTVWNNGKGNIATNTSFGDSALRLNTTGVQNTAYGSQSLQSNTTGGGNTALGFQALSSNTSGNNNIASGFQSLLNNTTGVQNTAYGTNALSGNTTGGNNTALGFQALLNNTTGNGNIAIGDVSGRFISNGSTPNATGSDSIFIGTNTRALADGQTNQIVIGANAIGHGSNTVTLGNSSIVTTILRGNVGIGTTSPNQLLHIEKDQNTYTNLRVRNNDAGSSAYTMIALNSSGNSWGMRMGSLAANSNRLDFVIDAFGSPVERMGITSGGNVVINNLGTGTVYSNSGTLTNTNPSDERLKENITDLGYGLNEILQLRPVSYNWINDTANQGTQFGFIAQEVQEIMPELINEFTITEDDEEVVRLGLDKEAIFVTLVNAIKELKAEINVLKN